jgi:hypothetical protein
VGFAGPLGGVARSLVNHVILILCYFNLEKETLVEANSLGYATSGLLLQKDKNNN